MAIELVRKLANSSRGGEIPAGVFNSTTQALTLSTSSSGAVVHTFRNTGVGSTFIRIDSTTEAYLELQRNSVQKWRIYNNSGSDELYFFSGGIVGQATQAGSFTLGPVSGSANILHQMVANTGTVELKVFSANAGAAAATLSIRNSGGTAFNDGIKLVHGAGVFKFRNLTDGDVGSINVTTGGSWAIGSSLTTAAHFMFMNAVDATCRMSNANTGATGVCVLQLEKAAVGLTQPFIDFYSSGSTQNGRIAGTGANSVGFTGISDSRVKENIADLPPQLANIMALRPVEFDYIGFAPGEGHQIGFIAQEMQVIYPDAVHVYNEAGHLGIAGWSQTDARIVKALQELKAEFDAYVATHP